MYQCPEMLMGSPTGSQASDVWSLGCMLYELLTQAPLFPGKSECLRPILVGGRGASGCAPSFLGSWDHVVS